MANMRTTRSSKTRRMVNNCRREAEGYASKRVAKFRSLAAHQFLLRRSCVEESRKAYREGDGAKAKHFALLAAEHKKRFYDLHRKAAREQFLILNRNRPDTEVDLHGLYVNEAVEKVRQRLLIIKGQASTLRAIVGKGNHSRGVARIKPAMQQFLKGHGYKYSLEDGNLGVFVIHVASGDANGTEVYQEEDFSIINAEPRDNLLADHNGPIESILIEDTDEENAADSDSDIEVIEILNGNHATDESHGPSTSIPRVAEAAATTISVAPFQNVEEDDSRADSKKDQENGQDVCSENNESQPSDANARIMEDMNTCTMEDGQSNNPRAAAAITAGPIENDERERYHNAEEGHTESAADEAYEESALDMNGNPASSPNPFDDESVSHVSHRTMPTIPEKATIDGKNEMTRSNRGLTTGLQLGMNPDGTVFLYRPSQSGEVASTPSAEDTEPSSGKSNANVDSSMEHDPNVSEDSVAATKKRKQNNNEAAFDSSISCISPAESITPKKNISIKKYDEDNYSSPGDPANSYLTTLHSAEESKYVKKKRRILDAVYDFLITNNVCERNRSCYLDYLEFLCETNKWKLPGTPMVYFSNLKSSQICSWIRFLRFNPSFVETANIQRLFISNMPRAILTTLINKGHDISTDERIVLEVISKEIGIYSLSGTELRAARQLLLETMALCQKLTHPERRAISSTEVPNFPNTLTGHYQVTQWILHLITGAGKKDKISTKLISCLPDFLPYMNTFVQPAFKSCDDPFVPLLLRQSLIPIAMDSLSKQMKKLIQQKYAEEIENFELKPIIRYVESRKRDKAVSAAAPKTKEYLNKLSEL
ncbi:hypothetical protein TRVA0_018S02718 [Trichomonascus vanleenenianus]|uniref:uncharacterized protein n=1 Tax=Trichomonascus vanleenenianus TaxID=2268995 RepID=UPI003EC957B9